MLMVRLCLHSVAEPFVCSVIIRDIKLREVALRKESLLVVLLSMLENQINWRPLLLHLLANRRESFLQIWQLPLLLRIERLL